MVVLLREVAMDACLYHVATAEDRNAHRYMHKRHPARITPDRVKNEPLPASCQPPPFFLRTFLDGLLCQDDHRRGEQGGAVGANRGAGWEGGHASCGGHARTRGGLRARVSEREERAGAVDDVPEGQHHAAEHRELISFLAVISRLSACLLVFYFSGYKKGLEAFVMPL